MIENIPTPLVSFAGSGVAGFFMGMFLRRVLKLLVIFIGSFLGAVFLVIQWMQAGQYIQGQVDWNRVGNDTMAWFQSLSAQVSSSDNFGNSRGPPASAKTLFLLGILGCRKGVYFDATCLNWIFIYPLKITRINANPASSEPV
jgi:uncharacterized membrane protein (Fun14 family)